MDFPWQKKLEWNENLVGEEESEDQEFPSQKSLNQSGMGMTRVLSTLNNSYRNTLEAGHLRKT
jgi:hypothetical protein